MIRRIRWIRVLALGSLIALPLLTSGCSWFQANGEPEDHQTKLEDSQNPDVNQGPNQKGPAKTDQETIAPLSDDADNNATVTMYFEDANGYVAPVSLPLAFSENIGSKALSYMVKGGPEEAMLPQGFTALLPEGTQVKSMNIKDGTAIVDFSKEFTKYDAKDERKILEAITWTLTGFPSVNQVRLWVDGHALTEMPVAKTPLDQPLSRSMGINLENVANVNFSESMPVTLYFTNRTGDDFEYYVPVTRMVPQSNDVAMATMQQLIDGPDASSPLNAVFASPTASVLHVEHGNGKLTVDFNKDVLAADNTVPTETLQAVILSLTENDSGDKVQIMVDGSSKIDSTDHVNYGMPVNRPLHVNEVKS